VNTKILTRSGLLLDLQNPRGKDIIIEDIAHGLSRQFRFGGMFRDYSVAQHSLVVAKAVADNWDGVGDLQTVMKVAMLHDAAEAYLRDMPTPAKQMLPDYQDLELALAGEIFHAFRVPNPHQVGQEIKIVTKADKAACGAEARLFVTGRLDMDDLFPPVDLKIDLRLVRTNWSMGIAKDQYLRIWKRLHTPNANLKELDWP